MFALFDYASPEVTEAIKREFPLSNAMTTAPKRWLSYENS